MITIKQLIDSRRVREDIKNIDFIKWYAEMSLKNCLEEGMEREKAIDFLYWLGDKKKITGPFRFIPAVERKIFFYKCAEYLITGDIYMK